MTRVALVSEPAVLRCPQPFLLRTRHAVGAILIGVGTGPKCLEWLDKERSGRPAPAASRISVGLDVNKERFAEVVLPHLSDAYGLARAMTGNRADAEDVVQESCLRAFRAIATHSGRSARAWLLTIVHHTACTWLVKNRPRAMVMVDDLEEAERTAGPPCENSSDTPETVLIAKSDSARLEAAIAALPLPFRETLVLRDIHDLDYREIARITDVPIGTVMSRLARARTKLIATLGREER